jgi:hypothetical protein
MRAATVRRIAIGALIAIAHVPMALAQAVGSDNETCLKVEPQGTAWRGTSQLYCLKFDPMRTRKDPFGRCQERQFEVSLMNNCNFSVVLRWRFNNGTREQERLLGPSEVLSVVCGQISDRCEGDVIAYAEKFK